MMRAVDLFAGGGGLSNGLKDAGYEVLAAVEADPTAAATYRANHLHTKVYQTDIRKIAPEDLAPSRGRLELLAACPPCQGFTSLTSKYRRDDPRNDLITELVRFGDALKPKTIMMENVPRLATSPLGRTKLDPVLKHFERQGYKVSWYILNAKDYGIGQSRNRLVVFASNTLVERPEPSNIGVSNEITLGDKIGGLRGKAKTYNARTSQPMKTLKDWHCHRRIDDITLARMKVAKTGGSRLDIPDQLRPRCHQGRQTGFLNTYSRMSWSRPSPTITAGCLTFSKGRFGHPTADRTITLREAGLLQGFPDDYILPSSSLERNLKIIGNAFPADLARASIISSFR